MSGRGYVPDVEQANNERFEREARALCLVMGALAAAANAGEPVPPQHEPLMEAFRKGYAAVSAKLKLRAVGRAVEQALAVEPVATTPERRATLDDPNVIRIAEIMTVLGLGETATRGRMKDPNFPPKILLGGPGTRPVGYSRSGFCRYVASLPREKK
jgi:predicted DNA-binding transcriptional regulator AlpA